MAAKTVKAIEALQRVDGGYGYWSNESCSSPHGSAYAVLALGRAAEVGYPVDTRGPEAGPAVPHPGGGGERADL